MSSTAIDSLFNDYCSHCYHYETSIGVCNEIHENVRSYPKIFIQKCNGNFFKNDITKAVQNKEDFIEENTVKENLTNANESITSAQHIKLVFGHIKDTKYEQDGPYVVAKHNSQVRDYYLTLPDSGSKIENLYCPVCNEKLIVELFPYDLITERIRKRTIIFSGCIAITPILVGLAITQRNNPLLGVIAFVSFLSFCFSIQSLVGLYKDRIKYFYKRFDIPPGHILSYDVWTKPT